MTGADPETFSDGELAATLDTVADVHRSQGNESARLAVIEAAGRLREESGSSSSAGDPLSWLERVVVFVGAVIGSAIVAVVVGAFFSLPAAAAVAAMGAAVAIEISHARPELAQRVVHGPEEGEGSS